MTGRGERLPRPARSDEWEILAVSDRVAKDWDKLCAVAANAAATAWDILSSTPTERTKRQHPLRADLAVATYEGREFQRWQYEVTSGGRIWYFVDPATAKGSKRPGRVLIEAVHIGHPKATE